MHIAYIAINKTIHGWLKNLYKVFPPYQTVSNLLANFHQLVAATSTAHSPSRLPRPGSQQLAGLVGSHTQPTNITKSGCPPVSTFSTARLFFSLWKVGMIGRSGVSVQPSQFVGAPCVRVFWFTEQPLEYARVHARRHGGSIPASKASRFGENCAAVAIIALAGKNLYCPGTASHFFR